MMLFRFLLFTNILVYVSSIDEREGFLNQWSVGLDMINRESDFESKQIKFNSSEEGIMIQK